MPIRFRCSYCNRLLGIATRKAGMETTCPHCGYTITVPVPQEEEVRTERINVDDVEEMLANGATEVVQPSAVAAAPAAPPSPPPVEKPRAEAPKSPVHPKAETDLPPMAAPIKSPSPGSKARKSTPAPAAKAPAAPAPKPPAEPKPVSTNPDERPLFERDMDEILGTTAAPEEPEETKKPKVSGMDALSLGEPVHNIVISAQKATFLMILVVVLLVLAFAAGYFLAPKG
jgi:phage FluMu protein Com